MLPNSTRALAAVAIALVAATSVGAAAQPTAPPGGRIVYRCAAGICSLSPATGATKTLFRAAAGRNDFVWAPDSRRLAYTGWRALKRSDTRVHPWEIVVSDANGRRRVLTAGYEPQWSPDGKRILYRHETTSAPAPTLYIIAVAGGKPRRLVPATSGAWSSNDEIAYSNRTGIWVMSNPAGRPRQLVPPKLAAPPRFEIHGLSWSPDGRDLAYLARSTYSGTAAEADKGRLVLVSRSGLRRVFPVPAYASSWSPNGGRIAVNSTDISVYDRDGDLVSRRGRRWQGSSPVFSPDSEWVAYADRATGEPRLAIRRADGSGRRLLDAGRVFPGVLFRWDR